jgi:nuclear GTP-binding protein
MVLVLNKIDMVPSDVVQSWVSTLRREYPTIAFKASTHKHRGHMNRMDVKSHKASQKVLDTKASVGAPALLQLLKNYTRSHDLKKGLTVGIIGYPNVGKSSVINSLKMTRSVQVSAAAGCTKAVQPVRLDANIMLIDSPGVLFSADEDNAGGEEAQRNLLLRNVLRVDQVEDPINAIQGIIERCTKEMLMKIYNIADFKNTSEFLIFVANSRGKIAKGGIANLEEAARCVLQDWNAGKIPFYTLPPETQDVQESAVVSSWGSEFDINALLDSANDNIVKVIRENNFDVHSAGMKDQIEFDDSEDEEADDMDMADMQAVDNTMIIEESDDEEMGEEEEPDRMHPREMVPLRNLKATRGKRDKVLEKGYNATVAPVMTKAELKKQAKKAKRQQAAMEDDDAEDYDFNDYV